MAGGVTEDGAAELHAALRGIAAHLDDLPAAQDAAELVRADAAARAPIRTGRLRSSIRAQVAPGGATVGTSVPYGAPVHYGTSRMPGRPFLTDALNANRDKIVDLYARDIQELINREVP